jgi:hypothetical protein
VTRSRPRLVGVVLSTAAAVAASVVVAASPASAHSPYDACGSGYVQVAKPRAVKTSDGVRYGKVHLLYNNDNGKNCVVTIKSRFHGKRTWTEAWIKVKGVEGPDRGWFSEYGNFRYYAGGLPQRKTIVFAKDKCVAFYGRIYSGKGGNGTVAEGGRLKMGNCGG